MLAVLAVQAHQQTLDLLASMTNGLGEGDPEAFVDVLDKSMPGYSTLAANVRALAAQTDTLCAIEPLTWTGGPFRQQIRLDWFLEITLKSDPMHLVRRREIVNCTLEKQKKGWRIVALEPLSLFASVNAAQ